MHYVRGDTCTIRRDVRSLLAHIRDGGNLSPDVGPRLPVSVVLHEFNVWFLANMRLFLGPAILATGNRTECRDLSGKGI